MLYDLQNRNVYGYGLSTGNGFRVRKLGVKHGTPPSEGEK